MTTLVVSLYGGPGTGKSKMMGYLFAHMKEEGISCEQVPEYAKRLTWQDNKAVMKKQIYIFGKQHHYLTDAQGQVQVIVTDAPLLNTLVYSDEETNATLRQLAREEYAKMYNLDIFLKRVMPYEAVGRRQTEDEAKVLDDITQKVLDQCNPGGYYTVDATLKSGPRIMELIRERIGYV